MKKVITLTILALILTLPVSAQRNKIHENYRVIVDSTGRTIRNPTDKQRFLCMVQYMKNNTPYSNNYYQSHVHAAFNISRNQILRNKKDC